jgi:hypothetical protein
MPSESNGVRRWAVCSRRSLRLRAQEPPPHPDQRLDQSPGAHPRQRPLRMLRRTRASTGPGGGPHRAQEPGRLGRPQQPAGLLLPLQCRQARHRLHRLPRPAGQLRPSPGRLRDLRAGGQRPGAAGERTGALHRRCLSGDAWAQPGDPAEAWIPKPDQVGWNGSMEGSTPPRACWASSASRP